MTARRRCVAFVVCALAAGGLLPVAPDGPDASPPPPPDTTPPSVEITFPAGGFCKYGTFNVTAHATDDRGLRTIKILVDGVVRQTCSVSGTAADCTYA